MDATGSICRKPVDAGSDVCVFYYAVVVKVGGRHLPVAEMLSTTHNVATIASWLLFFLHACRRQSAGCRFHAAVSDESSATMIALCNALNQSTLASYLRRCYKIATGVKTSDVHVSVTPPNWLEE